MYMSDAEPTNRCMGPPLNGFTRAKHPTFVSSKDPHCSFYSGTEYVSVPNTEGLLLLTNKCL